MNIVENSHDLRLPNWGPYTKKYIGISHIPDVKKGLRFDLSVFPGFYRRRINIPNVMWESGYHPWEAATDLNYFSHRHELEWKDQVYSDISFSELDDNTRLIRCECVNKTEIYQSLVLHFLASMNYPSWHMYADEGYYYFNVEYPEDAVWIDGVDYTDLTFAVPRPTDFLVPDGLYRGEVRDIEFVNGSGIGKGFGGNVGDMVTYQVTLPQDICNGHIVFRYRVQNGSTARFSFGGLFTGDLSFEGTGEFTAINIFVGDMKAGEHTLILKSIGCEAIELDGFVISSKKDLENIRFEKVLRDTHPEIIACSDEKSLILKYKDTENYYGMAWEFDKFQIREIFSDELDRLMPYNANNHIHTILKGNGEGHFTNVFLRPIVLEPNSTKVLYGIVCTGSMSNVNKSITEFRSQSFNLENLYLQKKEKAFSFNNKSEGDEYLFSQRRMAATLLTNVVYPVYNRRTFIRHNTPGRWWDCLYTWDSGFIGLGLLELDIERALDCLNAYLTEVGDKHGAFIHHGSPVPTQFYIFKEVWNRTQSKELLEYFYPKLRQYHRFLSGRSEGSTTRRLKSNMITTWDYFYNSGGWDDYPPQVYVHKNKLTKYTAPVVNTAQCIMTAKILMMAANELGISEDVKEYLEDIKIFSEALQKYSWDEKSGYFGYVQHNEAGNPIGIMKYEDSCNYNMGMDGVYPLIAGICTEKQKEGLINKIFSNKNMWTKIGISTVDQSAPYYKKEGYWNGAVWMPHQWFIWKAMLDIGRADLAYRIAETALSIWKNEVEASYNCYEHFIVESGRGAGWHQFGGLSTPVLSWYCAYYQQGLLTTGFNTWIVNREFSHDYSSLRASIKLYCDEGSALAVIATMNPNYNYRVLWNGSKVSFNERVKGTLELNMTADVLSGELVIERLK